MKKGVNLAEPVNIDMVYMETINKHNWNQAEYVRIGIWPKHKSSPPGTVMLRLSQFKAESPHVLIVESNLTREEVDVIIAGLEKAKTAMGMFETVETK